MKRVLVIIPCFNEQYAIAQTIQSVQLAFTQLTTRIDYEILVVNDGSSDDSLLEIQKTGVKYLNLPINLGIGGAMQSGYQYVQKYHFDIAIQLDGDGQHDPTYITDLMTPILNQDINVVIGSRFIHKEGFQSTSLRRKGIKYFSWLNDILVSVKILDSTSGFRALDKKAIDLVCEYYPETYPEPESIVLYACKGLKIKEVPVKMNSRETGKSSITGFKSFFYMFKVTLGTLFLYLRLKFNQQ